MILCRATSFYVDFVRDNNAVTLQDVLFCVAICTVLSCEKVHIVG